MKEQVKCKPSQIEEQQVKCQPSQIEEQQLQPSSHLQSADSEAKGQCKPEIERMSSPADHTNRKINLAVVIQD